MGESGATQALTVRAPVTRWAPGLFLLAAFGFTVVIAGGHAQAATDVVAGPLASSTTWTAAASPFNLQGTVTVPAGVTLTIEGGATVRGAQGTGLVVEGDLRAVGTATFRISFEPAAAAGLPWKCLEVVGAGNATIRFARLSGCDTGLRLHTTGFVTVADTELSSAIYEGVYVSGDTGGVVLDTLTITGGATSVRADGGNVRLSMDRSSLEAPLKCVDLNGVGNVTLRGSTFTNCGTHGVVMALAADIIVANNTFMGWTETAVEAQSVTRLQVTGNSFQTPDGDGVRLVGAAQSEVANNTLAFVDPDSGPIPLLYSVGVHDETPLGPNNITGNTITRFRVGVLVKKAIFTQRVQANSILEGLDTGIEILDSPNQTVRGNAIQDRLIPFAVNVTSLATPWYYRQFVDDNNTVNGRPLRYLLDRKDETFDLAGGPAMFALYNATNVVVENGALEFGTPSLLIAASRDVTVRSTTFNGSITGILVASSTRVTVEDVKVEAGFACIELRSGAQNRVLRVNATRCQHVVLTQGSELDFIAQQIFANKSGPVVFYAGTNLTLRDSSFSQVTAAFSNTASFWQRRENGGGSILRPGSPTSVKIYNISVLFSQFAMSLVNVSGVELRGLDITQTSEAIHLENVTGLLVNGSSFGASRYAIFATDVSNSRVEGSIFAGAAGIAIKCTDCFGVTIESNTFVSNGVGVFLRAGAGCVVTRNFFFANGVHAVTNETDNDWDDGAIGNLWDDYDGPDADGDGIGDTPYPISPGVDVDRFPIVRIADFVPPVAVAGPDVLESEDEPVVFNGYLSSDDVGIRAFLWSFADAGETVTVVGLSTRYIFETPGVYTVTLTIIDWGGNRATDSLVVTVYDRTPPHADAGGDRTVDEDVAAVLDASASFDNDPKFPAGAGFTWIVTDLNGTFTLYGPVVSWTFATPGNYTVKLFVVDGSDFSDSDTIYITVRDRTAPVLGPLLDPMATEDAPFRVYGSNATDNDPSWPAGMTWWFELWRGGILVNTTDESPAVFNRSEPAFYMVYYFVSDAAGNVGSTSLRFIVADITPPDLRDYGERQAEVGVASQFDLSLATDNDLAFPEGANATWVFIQTSGRVTAQGAAVSFSAAQIGEYTVALSVRDAAGNLAEKSFLVRVRDTRPPVVSITGPATVEAGRTVSFEAVAADPSGINRYAWTVTGLSGSRAGQVLSYRFPAPGSYQLTVEVEDALGHMAEASFTVVVVDTVAPPALVEFTPLPINGTVRLLVLATLQSAYLGTDAVQVTLIEWAWGDGNVTVGPLSSHAYAAPGNYSVLVRVMDAAGNVNTTTVQVEVVAPETTPPPPADNSTGIQPTGGLPPAIALALVVAGVAGGVAVGLVAGRRTRRPPEGET